MLLLMIMSENKRERERRRRRCEEWGSIKTMVVKIRERM